MKILIASRGIPSKKSPQFGSFAMDQAKALKAAGHDVAIMSVDGLLGKHFKKPGVSSWVQDGIKCYEIFGMPLAIVKDFVSKSWGISLERWTTRLLFNKVLKDFGQPDIVHSHFLPMTCMTAAVKKDHHIRLVATEHWSVLAEESIPPYVQKYGNMGYPEVDRLICVSENLRRCVLRRFGKDSCVIHNLIDTDNLEKALVSTNNPEYTIVGLGSLIKRKGFDVLIKAFAASSLVKVKAVVKILGGGEEEASLKALIDKSGLTGKVILCGRKNKEEVFAELHKADLYVLSSRLENFSVALIEATANGVPAIATLCGGVEEYPVRDVLKVPVDDVEALKDALETQYARRKEIDRQRIQKETLDNFSPSAIVARLEKVYEDLMRE